MEHRRDPDPGTQMLRIGGDFDHCVGACPHQQIVDLAFVLMCDISDGFGQSEDEMKIPHGQQLGLTCRQPCLRRTGLALGAMTIAA
jgi:hypothetical protein